MGRALLVLGLIAGLAGATAEAQTLGLPLGAAALSQSTADGGGAEPGATPAPPPASERDLRLLTALLSDPSILAWLNRAAETMAADGGAAAASPKLPMREPGLVQSAIDNLRAGIDRLARATAALPAEVAEALTIWQLEMGRAEMLRSLLFVAIFLVVGIGTEAGFRAVTRGVRRRLERAPRAGLSATVGRTLTRGVIDLIALALFGLGSLGAFLAFDWHPIVELFVASLLLAVLVIRAVDLVAALVFAPRAPSLRLVPIAPGTARQLYGWTMALATVGALGGLFLSALEDLGFLPTSRLLLAHAVTLVPALMVIALVWRTCAKMDVTIRGGASADDPYARLRTAAADLWPLFATAYAATAWSLCALGEHPAMWTMIILSLVPPLDFALRRITAAAYTGEWGRIAGETGLDTGPTVSADADATVLPPWPFLPVIDRAVRTGVVMAALALLQVAWGFEVMDMSGAPPSAMAMVLDAAYNVIVTLLLADLVWQAARTAIDRKLAELGGGPGGSAHMESGEGGGAAGPGARERTLLPLIRNFILVVVIAVAGMTLLSSLGVNIGPLLAGAGVVGIAIGFGAQTLVRDIVAGVFFLLEDAFRVGEYIEVEELRGTVEAISIRSLKLRHHRGQIQVLPFGEVKSLTNYSRDWIIMKLEFRVPFDTDLLRFKKIVKKVGQELLEHPEYSQHILEPVKSQGVRRMEEFNMVVGVKFMTKPGEQWVIRRETYQRILTALDHAGIRLATRNVQVQVASGDVLTQLAAAAAEPAVETPVPPHGPTASAA